MAVKENELTKKLSDTHDEDWWFRMVDALGNSKDMLKSLLRLDPSQIEGLVSALASLSTIPVIKSQTAYIKTDGTINGSGTELKMLTNEAGLNAAFDGFYSVVTPFLVADLGYIKNVIAFDNSVKGQGAVTPSVRTMSRQLIFSTLGILYREYSSSTWGVPIFMGGTNDNFVTTYSALSSLATANKLTPGTLYKITDHGNDNGIIIQAATSSTFKPDGIRLGLVPAHYIAGTYSTVAWLGVWRLSIGDGGVAAGNKAVYMGRVWTNLTGNIGTVHADPDLWALDATNWALSTDSADYVQEVFGCTYRLVSNLPATYPKGYISKQWDSRGNSFGIEIEPATLFLVDYNDWGNAFVWGNKLKSCRNNICIDANSMIHDNFGGGDIHTVSGSHVYENELKDFDNNIQLITGTTAVIYKNVLTNDADIQYLTGASNIAFNKIGGDIKGDSVVYCTAVVTNSVIDLGGLIKDCITVAISNSKIYGTVDGNKTTSAYTFARCTIGQAADITNNDSLNFADTTIESYAYIYSNPSLVFTRCKIGSSIAMHGNTDVQMTDTEMKSGAEYSLKTMTGFSMSNSVLDSVDVSVQTIGANISIRQSKGKICASVSRIAGSFTVPTGAYSALTVAMGMTPTTTRSNGVTVSGLTLIAQYAGWHKVKLNMSLLCSIGKQIEANIHVGATLKAGLYDKAYFEAEECRKLLIDDSVLLAVGDVVSVKYRHADGGTLTYQHLASTFSLEYDN